MYVLVFFPIFEEVVYRFFIFKYCSVLGFSGIQAMIFATLCFEFSHIYYLGFKAINKLFFSFIQSMLFLVFQSLLLIIRVVL
ncbi:CPBP family glutamic-type intramembrane protease, partial [Lactobacillus crispatus]|uniref:CPBP family glutamic-type intramembrane protease n=1 Tax=Lactobacillus crispatus TaxID=47770 RepID=UPI0021C86129